MDWCFLNSQLFHPSGGEAFLCWQSSERSRQPSILVEKAGIGPRGRQLCPRHYSVFLLIVTKVFSTILPQSKPSPHPSPSCSTQSRNAPARPQVKPPPVPPGKKDELVQPLTQSGTTPQRQSPHQVKAQPSMKSEQKQMKAPPPPSGLLDSLIPNNNPQPSTVPKPRPDPPNRPPPPCPVNKPLLVIHF